MSDLGLVSVSFRKNSPEEVIRAAAKAGLSCIEWGSDVHAPADDTGRLKQIAEEQKAAGLYCCSYGTYFRLGKNDPSELQAYIDAAKILGTNILRLWCGTKGSAEYTREEREQLYESCRACARIAQQAGVTLCMECHNNTLTDDTACALALMKAVDSPAFRMYYQPNQYHTQTENLEMARALAPYTVHVHVFNWILAEDGTVERYSLTEAQEIWRRYFESIPGKRCMLLEFMPDDRIETLPQEAQALKTIASASV